MEPNVSQGLSDWFKASFDYKKFCADPRLKVGIESIAAALKDATSSPVNVDDMIIDGTIKSLEAWLESISKSGPGPLVVGGRAYTLTDAKNFMTSLGSQLPASCVAKLEQYPQIIEALEGLPREKQLKAASSDTILDRLVTILLEWGPFFLKIAMLILPFLI